MEMNPDILELVRRHAEPGEPPELVKSTEWSYSYRIGEKQSCHISRFVAEQNFEVNAPDIQERWKQWGQNERWDFASNWWCKPTWNHDDTEILEMIMSDGDDFILSCCTQAFLKHPDRDRAISFLIDRTSKGDFGHEPLNYIQVLGMSKDVRAIAAIRPYYDKYRRALETEAEIGVPDDVFFGPIPYSAYFSVAGALFKISGSSEYKTAIRKYFDHPSEQVRWWAEHALEVEGPTSAARDAKYKEKREKR
jgi:hypothetical protein